MHTAVGELENANAAELSMASCCTGVRNNKDRLHSLGKPPEFQSVE